MSKSILLIVCLVGIAMTLKVNHLQNLPADMPQEYPFTLF